MDKSDKLNDSIDKKNYDKTKGEVFHPRYEGADVKSDKHYGADDDGDRPINDDREAPALLSNEIFEHKKKEN